MAKVIILGSAHSIPDDDHDTTHLAILGEESKILVDCGSKTLQRLLKKGVGCDDLTDIILTHFHPDHVFGLPLLLMNLWQLGRKKPIMIHGLHDTIDRFARMMDLYEYKTWPDFFPLAYHRLPTKELTPTIQAKDIRVITSPVIHFIPTLGLRVEFNYSHRVMSYSCDTGPCQQVEELARNANLLIHEASGEELGHSTAAQAGEIAAKARVEELLLIHYPPDNDSESLINEAKQAFRGRVALAVDLMELEF